MVHLVSLGTLPAKTSSRELHPGRELAGAGEGCVRTPAKQGGYIATDDWGMSWTLATDQESK